MTDKSCTERYFVLLGFCQLEVNELSMDLQIYHDSPLLSDLFGLSCREVIQSAQWDICFHC